MSPFEYFWKAFEEILSNFPGVIQTFIMALILVIFAYYFLIKEEVLEWIKSHIELLKQILRIVFIIIVMCLIVFCIFDHFYFPKPPENQLVVVISPFYFIDNSGNFGHNIPIADDFKQKIETNTNLGIKVKRLDLPPIQNIKDAKFRGKKEGAHLVIYGETKVKSGGIEEIECHIIPLPSLKVTLTERKTLKVGNIEKKYVEYSTVTDEPIVIIESLKENVSSIVYTISALEKYKKSNYTSAINLFKSIKNYKEDSSILFYVGNCYCFNNNINESINYFNKAIDIDPQFKDAWNNKGAVLANLGRYEEAIAAFDKAIDIDLQDKEAWYNKGIALADLGRYEEAIAAFGKAIDIDLQHKEAWNNKGAALADLGRYEEAIAAYDKAIDIDP